MNRRTEMLSIWKQHSGILLCFVNFFTFPTTASFIGMRVRVWVGAALHITVHRYVERWTCADMYLCRYLREVSVLEMLEAGGRRPEAGNRWPPAIITLAVGRRGRIPVYYWDVRVFLSLAALLAVLHSPYSSASFFSSSPSWFIDALFACSCSNRRGDWGPVFYWRFGFIFWRANGHAHFMTIRRGSTMDASHKM